jgi:transcriptional regulator with GAF, ATPase, and Fis domain
MSERRESQEFSAVSTVQNVGEHERGTPPLVLLVIVHGSMTTYPLPVSGQMTIGRGNDANVRIEDRSISRRHLILHTGAELAVEDAGSANGSSVAGERLRPGERRRISVGETIDIGAATVVVLAARHRLSARPRRLLTHDSFETRIEDECAAALVSHRPFCVACLSVGGTLPPEEVRTVLAEVLGADHPVAVYGPNEYEALLLGMTPEAAAELCARVEARLAEKRGRLRYGIAAFPRDARTPEALLDRARQPLRTGHTRPGTRAIIVSDPAMIQLHQLAKRVATGKIGVLLLGETGSGKEIFAEVIHRYSPRHAKPLLRLNCAAFAETLLESELFGYEKGAFTGAMQAKPGLLESADGGTVFLDEIGEMPLALQAKLLRVIQERQVLRVGGLKPRPIDVRFIAATNRDLDSEVARGTFRQDLFYRLNGIALVIPPLRERPSEIAALAELFVQRAAQELGRRAPRLSAEAVGLLRGYVWPGNIRELQNVIERAVLLSGDEAEITRAHLPVEKLLSGGFAPPAPPPPPAVSPMPVPTPTPTPASIPGASDDERARIVAALERFAGNQTYAARELGIARSTLVVKMTAYNLPRPRSGKPR